MPEDAEQLLARVAQTQHAVLARLDRAERDVQDLMRDLRELREHLDETKKELMGKLDGVKAWLITALIALVTNLVIMLITNAGRILGAMGR